MIEFEEFEGIFEGPHQPKGGARIHILQPSHPPNSLRKASTPQDGYHRLNIVKKIIVHDMVA